ncbi:MAG TPA: type II toxin-antitoxin system RelE/ParE family toxin [Chitinophagales bacterium]|nr:type II toxin-antitoxin system RelE/ParE family toxin [Chitinophagales bacterium]HMW95529.1 type II toxin-antitoxin system RelE/ParE family toxin [Chitinophagales bacterium]HNC65358.1 type II toxin-antitoxin system RelE/ParE family toxin [Chitinophagales bacterium]HND46733.1 type II toxin-antitoxin system RelE/ParE family toxin [Chitinophagales bacterium]HNG09546.1 type II toxin-antitoxin system RelE/ParE family toxin [Chitinophagales bacterium]
MKEIECKPDLGTYLGNNCYKIRMSIESKGKGKSGGARVITYLFLENKNIYLLTIYDKSEKSDLQIGELKEMINSLSFE